MTPVSYDPRAVSARLREASRLSDLRVGAASKVDMTAAAVTARLRQQSALRTACLRWGLLDPKQR
jgi:hypothetical protein